MVIRAFVEDILARGRYCFACSAKYGPDVLLAQVNMGLGLAMLILNFIGKPFTLTMFWARFVMGQRERLDLRSQYVSV